MDEPRKLTQDLAKWIHHQASRPVEPALEHHVRRMVLDHLGGVIASSLRDVSGFVGEHVRRLYGTDGPATAIGFGRTTMLGAAVVNGTNGHGIETDDGYTPGSFHPTSVTLPAVFAVSEARNASAEQIIRAAAIGMEVGCRIAGTGHPATRRNHFHNTPIAGVFGAAASAAVLMDLDEAEIAAALGIAGSHASGLFEFLGQSAEVKRLHPGKAARDGIASADLAAAGLTGPRTILEGRDGYFAAYAGEAGRDWSPAHLCENLGEEWVILESYIKPYPCCRHLHGAIDSVLALRERHQIDAEAVGSVHIDTFATAAGHDGTDVETMMGAQLSVPYSVAVALRSGAVTLADFEPAARADPETLDLMKKVSLSVDAAAEAAYPRHGRPAEVTVRLTDGKSHTHRTEHPYGESVNPVTDGSLETKVHKLVEPVIGDDGARHLIDAAWKFEDLKFLSEVDERVRAHRP